MSPPQCAAVLRFEAAKQRLKYRFFASIIGFDFSSSVKVDVIRASNRL
jgi:hypothetical protein